MKISLTLLVLASVAALNAQTMQRRASITNRASGDREKCTIEVVVDGAAEVEIRGDNATLRNISGQLPQWRRFECSAPMPPNPANFRFNGVDGRGRQQLVRDPRGGGSAVIRIEDPDGGAEGYTFDITWGGGGGYSERVVPAPPPAYQPGPYQGGGNRRFTSEQAIEVCRESVRQQAFDRFHPADVRFRRINIDDNPGRNDWVVGAIDVRYGNGREEPYRFSCSVNFDTGRVRSAQIDRFDQERGYERDYERGPGPGASISPGIDSCQREVENRLRGDGYDRVNILSIRAEDRPGGGDRVLGNAQADGRYRRTDSFDFACTVNLERGTVRTVDVTRR
jgi:hypothetical protein